MRVQAKEYTSLHDLPGKAEWEGNGYVYVLSFSSGTVKVGSTTDARSRVAAHRNTAAGFGIRTNYCWVTPEYRDYLKGEQALLGAVAQMADSCQGREWFNGVDYYDVIAIAPELTYSNRGAQAQRRKSAAIQRCLRAGHDPYRWYELAEIVRRTGWVDVHEEFAPGQNGMTAWQLNALIERCTRRAAVPL